MTTSLSDFRSDPEEATGDNRSVMPFDVRGRTRATLLCAECFSMWVAVFDGGPLPFLGGMGNH